MIKLKTLILEGRPIISKMDEGFAFKVITDKILPSVVDFLDNNRSRWRLPHVTLEDLRKNIKKKKVEHYTNGQEIFYAIKIPNVNISPLELSIRKIAFRKSQGDARDEDVFDVGFYDFTEASRWGDLAWTRYNVKELARGDYKISFM